MERNYVAFISYRHKPLDIAAARRIHRMIERYTIPRELRALRGGKKHLGIVFRDQDELAAASDLTEELRRALDHSEFLVVICTPDTPESHWVSEEIRYFLSNPRHNRQHVLAVLADGEPEQSFPAVLTWDETGKRPVDPLAADLRSKRSGSRLNRRECRRLLAPMVGCSYDDLIQRERRRRTLQLTAGIAAALAVSIGFSSVLLLKNQQIDAQRQEVQLRESQLLAEKAVELYEDGRLYEAIDSAIQALPSPGDAARPYYAPAESILMETASVFSQDEYSAYLLKTVIDQPTSIANLCFSQDGSRVVTVDHYGELRCFDAIYGTLQWNTKVADTFLMATAWLLAREPQGDLLCASGGGLYSLSMSTGEILWAQQLLDSYFIYDRQQDRVACVESLHDNDTGKTSLSLIVLSAETGQIQKSIPLGKMDTSKFCQFVEDTDLQFPVGGVFSKDGRYFAGVFRENLLRGGSFIQCFVADLEQETGSICLRQKLDKDYGYDPIGIEIRGDDLYLALNVPGGRSAAMVMRANWREGSVQWQMCTPEELDAAFMMAPQASFAIFGKKILTVGRGNAIYIIDPETGEILDSVQFLDRITELRKVDDYTFGISLANGCYFLSVYSSDGFLFSYDSPFRAKEDVGEHRYARLFGDGILHLQLNDHTLGFVDYDGKLATVDAKNGTRLTIHKAIIRKRGISYSTINLQNVFCIDMCSVLCPNGQLVLGPLAESEDDAENCVYAVVDLATHTIKKAIDIEIFNSDYDIYNWILPDASGYIRQEDKGGLTVVCSGHHTTLAENNEDNYSTVAGVYLPDGSVLNTRSDNRNIVLWQNGQQIASSTLPEEQVIAPDMFVSGRLLKAGANGYVLVGTYNWGTPVAARSLAVYNWTQNIWSSLSGDKMIPNLDAIAFAQEQPLLAFADGENNLCVWDLNRAEAVRQIQTVINPDSIAFLGFVLDDTHLIIKTKDSLVLIYDVSTGELNYREKLNNLYGEPIRAYEDQKNQRLYLIDGDCAADVNGICLDLRSWTKLGQGGGMLCFDNRTGELYHLAYGDETSDLLKYAYIPNTDELIHFGQELLNVQ